jgi:hypothetical protein
MKKTIFGNPIRTSNEIENDASILERLDAELQVEESPLAATDPAEDWLDEGIPDLSSVSHHYFDLAKEFDISRYLDILADEVNYEVPARRNVSSIASTSAQPRNGVDRSIDASTVAPLPSAWAT